MFKTDKLLPCVAIPCVALTLSVPSWAYKLDLPGPYSGQIDTTLTYGATWRTDDRSQLLSSDVNRNDSNNNFDEGLVSNSFRMVSELELSRSFDNGNELGFFTRVTALYDDEVAGAKNDNENSLTLNSSSGYNGSLDNINEFHSDTEDRIGRNSELLDFFVYYNFGANSDHAGSVRVGKQVVSWGESSLIQTGISAAINPADVSKVALPGVEVKEILRPMESLYGTFAVTENLTFSAYYQTKWEHSITAPYGAYLNPLPDFMSSDGSEALLAPLADGFLTANMLAGKFGLPTQSAAFSAGAPYVAVERISDVDADNDGQWGAALNWYLPELEGTELGFYFINYHSKLPSLTVDSFSGTLDGTPYTAQCAAYAAGGGTGVIPAGPLAGLGMDCAAYAILANGVDNASVRAGYAEDIRAYAFSWSTLISWTDTAFSGEIAYHANMPLQTTRARDGLLAQTVGGSLAMGGSPVTTELSTREEVLVVQMTFLQNFANLPFADSALLLAELGWVHAAGLDDGELTADALGGLWTSGGDLWVGNAIADQDSWGYRLKFDMTWYDALGSVADVFSGDTLTGSVSFAHDVEGTSPLLTGFSDNRKALSLGIQASWLDSIHVGLTYTDFFGSGTDTNGNNIDEHVLDDRDNLALTLRYQF